MFYVNVWLIMCVNLYWVLGLLLLVLFLLYFESKIYVLVVWKWDKMTMVIYLLIHVYV
jgi:hypothetical protein